MWIEILKIISFFGDLCIVAITLYTFYLGFISKRVSIISYGWGGGREGDHISLLFKNHSMKTISIQSCTLVVDNKYSIKIGDWDDETPVLTPLGSLRITTEPYSYLMNYSMTDFYEKTCYAKLETSDGIIYAKFRKKTKIKKNANLEIVTVVRNYLGNRIVLPGYKYALTYQIRNSEPKTLFIYGNGAMTNHLIQKDKDTGELIYFNALPTEIANDKAKIQLFLQELFDECDGIYYIQELETYNKK